MIYGVLGVEPLGERVIADSVLAEAAIRGILPPFFYSFAKFFYPLPHETDVIVCVAVAAFDGVCKA